MAQIRSLSIGLRMDTAEVAHGARKAVETVSAMASRIQEINNRLEEAAKKYAMPQAAHKLDDSEYNMMSAVEEKRRAMETDALNKRMELMQREADYQAQLQDRIYNATHNRIQVELRDLDRRYAAERKMAENSTQLRLVDEAYAAERHNVRMGRGDLSRGARYAMTGAIGGMSPQAGAMLGAINTYGLQGGVAIGGLAVAVGAARAAWKEHTDAGKRATEVLKEMSESGRRFAATLRVALPTTSRGARYEQAKEQTQQELARINEQMANEGMAAPIGMGRYGRMPRVGQTDFDDRMDMYEQQKDTAQRNLDRLSKLIQQEQATAQRRVGEDSDMDVRELHAQTVYSGPNLEAEQLRLRQKREMIQAMREVEDGGLRDIAGLRETHAWEMRVLEQKQREEAVKEAKKEADEKKRLAQEVADMNRDLHQKWLVAMGGSQHAIDLHNLERELKARKANADEIRRQLSMLEAIRQIGEANNELALKDRIYLARGGEERALLLRDLEKELKLRGATTQEIERQKKLLNKALDAEFAKTVRDGLKTASDRFKEFRDKVVSNTELTDEEKARALEKKMGELMGKSEAGKFYSGGTSRWEDIQSKLLAPKDDTQKLTLEETRAVREEIARLRKEGMPIKGGS